jgi:DNA-binding IclR family transcriptional regulator
VLEGAFRILRALPDAGRDHQVLELSRITGIPRPSVYRLLAQLRVVGAVERPRDHYVLAQSLVDIARRTGPLPGLRNQAFGVMQSIRAQTGATVSLVIPTEQGCSALDVIPGRETLPTPVHAGIAMPRSAAAALVFDPTPALERIDPSAGWASDDARVVPDLTCYASAIRVAGRIEAVLQISTTRSRPADRFATLIRLGADRIATQLPSSYQR